MSDLALSFIRTGLIDEFRFVVDPIVIGGDTLICKGLGRELDLELINSRTFGSGNVLLSYRPTRPDNRT